MDINKSRELIDNIDNKLQELFEERMAIVKDIAQYKKGNNLPIEDTNREKEMIERHLAKLNNPELKEYYKEWLEKTIEVSKKYQSK